MTPEQFLALDEETQAQVVEFRRDLGLGSILPSRNNSVLSSTTSLATNTTTNTNNMATDSNNNSSKPITASIDLSSHIHSSVSTDSLLLIPSTEPKQSEVSQRSIYSSKWQQKSTNNSSHMTDNSNNIASSNDSNNNNNIRSSPNGRLY